ncbi:MAG: polymer-forming cytoskeletal protein, partial [Candidatus Bipolaricaulota bacterium]|nr:polymer-forming cytoskeletal protein [Candidatus Bipolaricaulota bacterium]
GAGTIGGGTYDRVSISGAGKITSDITAEELRISGAGKVQGRTEAEKIVASGSAVFAGDVIAEEMRVSGSARVDGRIEVKELKCSGTFKAAQSISSEYIKVSGDLRVGGDVEAEIFKTSGGFKIEGLLSADRIEVRLGGRCQAREIGGERIEVTRGGWKEKGILLDGLIKLFTGGGTAGLQTTQIEGDEILLENTTADIVRGKTVEIGPGCNIETVEYSESLRVADEAIVRNKSRV